jgi:hypothetical protein
MTHVYEPVVVSAIKQSVPTTVTVGVPLVMLFVALVQETAFAISASGIAWSSEVINVSVTMLAKPSFFLRGCPERESKSIIDII